VLRHLSRFPVTQGAKRVPQKLGQIGQKEFCLVENVPWLARDFSLYYTTNENQRSVPTQPSDIWSPDALRIDQSFLNVGAAKKLLTTVPVRKPNKQDFVRVNPDPAYRLIVGLIELKENREIYLLLPAVLQELSESEFFLATLYLTINRQRVLSVWPVKLSAADGRCNEWHTSASAAAERAMHNWIRMAANMGLGAYEISEAIANYGEPEWPEHSFMDILKIAFKNRVIETSEHPVIQQLRGL
jgi:hypothetical protein